MEAVLRKPEYERKLKAEQLGEKAISPAPPPFADSATATALDVAQNFFGLEAIYRQGALIMAGPIAFTLAEAVDEQLANVV